MKILIIHTFYTLRGGEDSVYEQESSLMAKSHIVRQLKFHNKPGLFGALQFLFSIWNISSAIKLKKVLKEFHPDVIHIHNWHFAAGPVIIRIANRFGIPVVMTLHNYRLICPSAFLLRNGLIYSGSINSSFPWRAVKYKLYKQSFLLTFWLAFIIWFHKKIGTWNMIDKYIVLSDFAKELFISSTLKIDPDKLIIKPNFVYPPKKIFFDREKHFLFVGRLSEEKGIKVLLEAFQNSHEKLRIAGSGPLQDLVKQTACKVDNITYLGSLDIDGVHQEMQQCSALIFPSIWFEGMPMTIIEAFSLGTPVIASNLGTMASMIQHGFNGLHFKHGISSSLKTELKYWTSIEDEQRHKYYQNAFETFQMHYTPKRSQTLLIDIYKELISRYKID